MKAGLNKLQCWNCGQTLADIPLPLSRHEHCPKCFEALHCCRLCLHYRPMDTVSCNEDRADPPTIKENANFCDWFKPKAGAWSPISNSQSRAAKSELEELFGAATDQIEDEQGAKTAEKSDPLTLKLDALFSKDP